ncbi:MAG: 2-phospho-L-lactate guanylyltransferase [Chloroflexota bacterium]
MVAVIPFRGDGDPKRRLAAVLDRAGRVALAEAMLRDVVRAVRSSPSVERTLVVSRAVRPAWLTDAVEWLVETTVAPSRPTDDDLNGALASVQAALGAGRSLLVVPADVPLLQAADIERVLDALEERTAVIVPDDAGDGTNCVAFSPADLMGFRFGPGSFTRHLSDARSVGATVVSLEIGGFGLDVDRPDDLAALVARGVGGETRAVLARLGLSGA